MAKKPDFIQQPDPQPQGDPKAVDSSAAARRPKPLGEPERAAAEDRPLCPKCHEPMTAYTGDREKMFTYYRCENPDCSHHWKRHKYRAKVLRPHMQKALGIGRFRRKSKPSPPMKDPDEV